MRIGIIASQYNADIVDRLLDSCLERLAELGVPKRQVTVVRVPGALEIPFAAQALLHRRRFEALVALGCVLQGQTEHHRLVAEGAVNGLLDISLRKRIPIAIGIITPGTHRQALGRSSGKELNRGREAAETALAMVRVARNLR